MRNSCGIFRNAAVIDERCDPLRVLEARPAQYQPSGFEDCDTSHLGVDLGAIKQRHWAVPYALEKQEGSRLAVSPNLEPAGSVGSTGVPADLKYDPPVIRPQTPSVRRRRRCGPGLWCGTSRDRRSTQTTCNPGPSRRFRPDAIWFRAAAR